jgi:hypothetical protein
MKLRNIIQQLIVGSSLMEQFTIFPNLWSNIQVTNRQTNIVALKKLNPTNLYIQTTKQCEQTSKHIKIIPTTTIQFNERNRN